MFQDPQKRRVNDSCIVTQWILLKLLHLSPLVKIDSIDWWYFTVQFSDLYLSCRSSHSFSIFYDMLICCFSSIHHSVQLEPQGKRPSGYLKIYFKSIFLFSIMMAIRPSRLLVAFRGISMSLHLTLMVFIIVENVQRRSFLIGSSTLIFASRSKRLWIKSSINSSAFYMDVSKSLETF